MRLKVARAGQAGAANGEGRAAAGEARRADRRTSCTPAVGAHRPPVGTGRLAGILARGRLALLRRPGLLKGGTWRQAAPDLVVAVLFPATLVAVALALMSLGWPWHVLVSAGLVAVDALLLVVSAAVRGSVWVLDGWRTGVLVAPMEPLDGRMRFRVAQYWALPPRRGHGRRLWEDGVMLANRFGAMLELVAMNPHLAAGPYAQAGFEAVAGQEEHWRPAVRRAPVKPGATTGPAAVRKDDPHAAKR